MKPQYVVLKTYHCKILGTVCARTYEHLPLNASPPNCGSCEVAIKPAPVDTEPSYTKLIIIPGKGAFRPPTGDE